MCLWVSYQKKRKFASLKSLKKGVGSEVGSGSVSQRSGSSSAPKCHGSPALETKFTIDTVF
jgi:hypothetical protein